MNQFGIPDPKSTFLFSLIPTTLQIGKKDSRTSVTCELPPSFRFQRLDVPDSKILRDSSLRCFFDHSNLSRV
jgi:hypothetical protein